MRSIDWRTSASRSVNVSAAHVGRWPTSASSSARNSSSVKPSIPQPVWCTRTISSVPRKRCEMVSERSTSSVTTPPALRITWASPTVSPRMSNRSRRASMHATMATRRSGRADMPAPVCRARCSSAACWNSSAALIAATLIHFAQTPRLDLVDEPANAVGLGDERAGLDPRDRLAHIGVEVAERLGGPLGLDAGLLLDRRLELVVGEGEHPAVGVVDQDDLLGAEQALGDGQRADLVVGHHAPGIADHVGLALLQAQD